MAEEDESRNDERMRKAVAKRMREQQLEQQKRDIAKRYLTPDAYDRLMNVRMANSEIYDQLINLIISMVQSNRNVGRITDAQLKSVLEKVTTRPDTTIEFKHK